MGLPPVSPKGGLSLKAVPFFIGIWYFLGGWDYLR
jgi:hypothetical protein